MSSELNSSPWRLDWADELSVCIPEIDAEHQHFIRLVNELNEAIIGRMGSEEINNRMRSILDDAVAHFAHEEALFREWRYPEAEAHAQILTYLHEIMGRSERDGTEYEWVEIGLKAKKALIEHLLSEDMKCRDYFLVSDDIPKGERW